jgi:3-dehydroquinate dehydratase
MALRVLVLHGPNVESFGEGRSLEVLDAQLAARAKALGLELSVFHANGEGALLDELWAKRQWADAAVVNPGSLAPKAFGLADALASWGRPSVEVLLEHESKGRGKSALRQAVQKQVHGQGDQGYLKALELLAKVKPADPAAHLRDVMDRTSQSAPTLVEVMKLAKKTTPRREEPAPPPKTMGRPAPKPAEAPVADGPRKTIGRREESSQADAQALKKPAGRGGLTRGEVKARVLDRLGGKLKPEQLALWARSQWASLQSGGPVEEGRRELLDEVLLMLAGSAKATDDVLLSAVAKLDA